jgi:hypothetical protein
MSPEIMDTFLYTMHVPVGQRWMLFNYLVRERGLRVSAGDCVMDIFLYTTCLHGQGSTRVVRPRLPVPKSLQVTNRDGKEKVYITGVLVRGTNISPARGCRHDFHWPG